MESQVDLFSEPGSKYTCTKRHDNLTSVFLKLLRYWASGAPTVRTAVELLSVQWNER